MINTKAKDKKIKVDDQIMIQLENTKNQLARAMADYSNLQKRTEEERSTVFKLASISFMTKILPIMDNLRQAQNHVKDSGIEIIIGQLETLAKDEGFSEIKINVGDKFDEQTSEVVDVIETNDEIEDNVISEVVLSGWKYIDGTVVRHARVKVNKLKI